MPSHEQQDDASNARQDAHSSNARIVPTSSIKNLRRAARLAMFIEREFPKEDQIEIVRMAVKAIRPELTVKEA
ncbi:MAG: hypothetical protein HY895_16820 [Deltaproteobacteria bacterium]|nr:hypothetical protein [Deltaproteobacteria bacterium]